MLKKILMSAMCISLSTMFAAQAVEPEAAADCAWHNDCSSIQGWRSNPEDPGMCAKVEQVEPSVIKVTQDGNSTWGKAAYFISGIDLEKNPMLYLKATKVDLNSAFTVQVASSDWSDCITVVSRTSADGLHDGNIRKAVRVSKTPDAWKGEASFWLVIVIEGKGKGTFIDDICIRAKK
ncbi:MAG TPA: hypothetical protein DCZ95_04860 [Verrucomicrobia bacterium]|nr:MAG: hypothetical protein A2X46_08410 [Lentisphaerae bacterium GWF2_57_35]HBA83407.1 hypothetical protein [Verrucomicrobiota bacterium]